MADYVIYADSACDLDQKYFDEWNVKRINLHFSFVDDGVEYADGAMPYTEFYRRMRAGRIAKTSAVATGDFKDAFREDCEAGVIYSIWGSRRGCPARSIRGGSRWMSFAPSSRT